MKRRRKNKERLQMATIVMILIAILLIIVVAWKLMNHNDTSTYKVSKQDTSEQIIASNGWDDNIVSNITVENVPIPAGFSYVSGSIKTGTIVKDENENKYLWIPYDEKADVDVSEYYRNVTDYCEIDSDTIKSIKKYNGFYVALNMDMNREDLEEISNEDYLEKIQELDGDLADGTVYTHLLSKEEIMQIDNFLNNGNFYIANNTIGIEGAVINRFSEVEQTSLSTTANVAKVNKFTNIVELGKIAATDDIILSNTQEYVIEADINEDGYTKKTILNGIQYKEHKQNSLKWAYSPYWEGYIGDCGCGPVSVTVALSGYKEYADITPPEVASGMRLTSYATLSQRLRDFGMQTEVYHGYRGYNAKYIREALSDGCPAVLGLDRGTLPDGSCFTQTPSGHISTALAIDGDYVYLSNVNGIRKSGWFPISWVAKYAAYTIRIYNKPDNFVDISTLDKTKKAETPEDVAYMLSVDGYEKEVPIPAGFRYEVTDGVISIQDSANKNLIYIWVPLNADQINDRKAEIKKLYESYDDGDGEGLKINEGEMARWFNDTYDENSDEYQEFLASIKEFGGFYMSEAEISKDSSGNFYNKARGMIGYSSGNTSIGGDYYREVGGVEEVPENESFLQFAKEVAEQVEIGNGAVVSHVPFGVEYDAAILWLFNTNSNKTFKYPVVDSESGITQEKDMSMKEALLKDSTFIGKYNNSKLESTASILESSKYLNGIWGLGGNLEELTQETTNTGENVYRGGHWYSTGESLPIASRHLVAIDENEDTKYKNVRGFRVCLYIKSGGKQATVEKFDADYEDDTIITIEGTDFKAYGDRERYINSLDETVLYYSIKDAKYKAQLNCGQTVRLKGVTVEEIVGPNGKKGIWAYIELINSNTKGFIEYKYLTNKVEEVEVKEEINYFIFPKDENNQPEQSIRYHKGNLEVYKTPEENDNNVLVKIERAGEITIIGKSIDQLWVAVDIDGETGYVKTSELRKNPVAQKPEEIKPTE